MVEANKVRHVFSSGGVKSVRVVMGVLVFVVVSLIGLIDGERPRAESG